MHECIYSFLEHMFNFHVRNLPQEQPTVIHKRTPTRMNFVHISMKTNYKKCIQFKREKTKSIEDARDTHLQFNTQLFWLLPYVRKSTYPIPLMICTLKY